MQKGEWSGDGEVKEVSPRAGCRVETEVEEVSNYNYFSQGLMVRSEQFQAAISNCSCLVVCMFSLYSQ